MRIRPGSPYPLGASWDGEGVNFALFSEHATDVQLCLFDGPDAEAEAHRLRLPERTDLVWHGYVPGVEPGQLYGYRVDGPYEPKRGHRFNVNKVLLDPYALAVGRPPRWDDALFGCDIHAGRDADLTFDERDSAPFAPLGAVVEPARHWADEHRPAPPWHKTVIHELHVKGFTKRHPGVPAELRGTFAGLGHPAAIDHLRTLGVTAVELMPVHFHLDRRHLVEKGLTNYWGYDTLGFFAPDTRFCSTGDPIDAVAEFQNMVAALHEAGIEVILDVVYNHTAEGDQLGPTLSFRGIDNRSYYRPDPENRRFYQDFTGCQNTLNLRHPRPLQLVMDSLRYWVRVMGVDGFRFDLASALARELYEVDKLGSFFDIIGQDPVLNRRVLIAEPWDLGEGGYQVGNFPVGWAEWNGKYRDAIRRFWRGEAGMAPELAERLAGSSDLYADDGRKPHASVNFVTSHDGFTLHDLVSYEKKHNHANRESNRDGEDENLTWNCGVEGPTDDPDVLALREKQKRNFVATLLLSHGVPMLRAGDELSQSRNGNNNPYCQDNELTWLDWGLDERSEAFLAFVERMLRIRREQPALHRRHFFRGEPVDETGVKDLAWVESGGGEMTDKHWAANYIRCFGMKIAGHTNELDEHGRPVTGPALLVLLNASDRNIPFVLPPHGEQRGWLPLVDTHEARDDGQRHTAGEPYPLAPHSLALLQTEQQNGDAAPKEEPSA